MSPEDDPHSPLLGFSSIGEDVPLSCGDLVRSRELGRRSRACSGLHTRTPEPDVNYRGKSLFLKTLMDAEAAANSAAIQLVAFKDAMEDEFADSRRCAIDKRRITRQRGLLLEKLEDFRRINKSVRQKLKQLQDTEDDRIESDHQTDMLLKKISQAESVNEQLKRDVRESERKVEELMDLRREEQVAELQAEFHDLRIKYANLLKEAQRTRDAEDREVEKLRQELKSHRESLSAAEQSLFECRGNLRRSERECSDESASVRRLQVQVCNATPVRLTSRR
ncbi:Outer dense fiber protein 2 [Liparis tanakae]|uniref:Outer dense fiber protein 2 n=1 Tax=Liparis tanakae TaxID=230148 RepID=A0A4Z2HPJ0_9TELE|nr:Outer dense fiber protein 2 [Liparis tanakae]